MTRRIQVQVQADVQHDITVVRRAAYLIAGAKVIMGATAIQLLLHRLSNSARFLMRLLLHFS